MIDEGKHYWDVISDTYEDLYKSDWCLFEDAVLAESLKKMLEKYKSPSVLDLGCGTGLGFELLQDLPSLTYTGVDSSQKMLEIFKKKTP